MQGVERSNPHAFPTFATRYDDVVAAEFVLACIRRHSVVDDGELVDAR